MDSTPDRAEDTDEADGNRASVPEAAALMQTASQQPAMQSAPPQPAPQQCAPQQSALQTPAPQTPGLAKWLLLYSALRLGLLVVLAAVLALVGIPLILALLFAVIAALPLSWLLFAGVRRRVNAAMAISTAHRRAERERLRSALDDQGLR